MLNLRIYKEMHEETSYLKFEIWCSTCNCDYSFIISEHLGKQMISLLDKKYLCNEDYLKEKEGKT